MFVRLEEIGHYEDFLRLNGMEIVRREELTEHCARTWDLCLEIIADAAFCPWPRNKAGISSAI